MHGEAKSCCRVHARICPLKAVLVFLFLSLLKPVYCDIKSEVLVETGEEFLDALWSSDALPLHIRLAAGAQIDVKIRKSWLPRSYNNGTLRISSSDASTPATLSLGWASEATVRALCIILTFASTQNEAREGCRCISLHGFCLGKSRWHVSTRTPCRATPICAVFQPLFTGSSRIQIDNLILKDACFRQVEARCQEQD